MKLRPNTKLLALIFMLANLTAWSQTTHYVNATATGADDGSTWADAYTDLQDALVSATSGDEIWVAAGSYYPTSGTDRYISFRLRSGVEMYGGFPATGNPGMGSRNAAIHVTNLSGDIGVPGDNTDNTSNVLVVTESDASTLLDGFTVRDGNAIADQGAGLRIARTGTIFGNYVNDIQVRNCIFTENTASSSAAVYICCYDNTPANPRFENCQFLSNNVTSNGNVVSAINGDNGLLDVAFVNCHWRLNDGPGLNIGSYSNNNLGTANGLIEACRFDHNYRAAFGASASGSGITNLQVEDCVVLNHDESSPGNSQGGGACSFYAGSGGQLNVNIDNSTFYNNHGIQSGAITTNSSTGHIDLLIDNSIFWGNSADAPPPGPNQYQPLPNSEDFFDLYTWGDVDIIVTNTILSSTGCATGVTCGTNSYFNTAPGFANPGLGDLSLNALSWAKDKGVNANVAPTNLTDIAGNARIFNGTVDLGAYEASSNTPPCPRVIYVNQNASGANNGLNWSNSYLDLQDALAFARANACVDTILIASGTYKPHTNDRTANFELVNDVEIYGGFPNTGNPWFADRDLVVHQTTLSGDIGAIGYEGDNSHCVVSAGGRVTWTPISVNLNAGTLIHGLSITQGARGLYYFPNNNSTFYLQVDSCDFYDNAITNQTLGGAIYLAVPNGYTNTVTDPEFRNCRVFNGNGDRNSVIILENYEHLRPFAVTFKNCDIFNNVASTLAGAAYIRGEMDVDFESCKFHNNHSTGNLWNTGGGAVMLEGSNFFATNNLDVDFTNCLFHHNTAALTGGAIYSFSHGSSTVEADFHNCTFADNAAPRGSTLYSYSGNSSQFTMNNCITWGNGNATQGAVAYLFDYGGVTNRLDFNNSLIESPNCTDPTRLYAATGSGVFTCGAGMLYNQNPTFTNPGGGVYSLTQAPASPAIDAGNNLLVPAGVTTDIAGNTRIFNGLVDMGCYENYSGMQLRPLVNIGTTVAVIYPGLTSSSATLSTTVTGGTAPYAYKWSTGATTSSITVGPSKTTGYSVTVTDANGLTLVDAITIFVRDISCKMEGGGSGVLICYGGEETMCKNPSEAQDLIGAGYATPGPCPEYPVEPEPEKRSVDENTDGFSDFTLYPNPAGQVLHLDLGGATYEQGYIFDVTGKLMITWQDEQQKIDLSGMPAGMYLIRLVGGGQARTKRFVKE